MTLDFLDVTPNAPQLFVDDHLIENRYNENVLSARVPHVLHPPRSRQLVLAPDAAHPWEAGGLGCPSVVYDPQQRLFHAYYQIWHEPAEEPGYPPGRYMIGYAESPDGLAWEKPALDQVRWGEHRRTNIAIAGQHGAFCAHVQLNPSARGTPVAGATRNLGGVPPGAFRGHRFLMFYGDRGMFLATSDDGRRWNEREPCMYDYHIDTFHTLVYDETLGESGHYVMFVRPTNIFTGRGPKRGNLRLIARQAGHDIWTQWDGVARSVLIPDAGDADRFYGLPVVRHGGVYFGFLWPLYESPQRVEVELVTSRDGLHWRRVPASAALLPVGERGTATDWESGQVYAGDHIIERGDEWWLYYTGWNGHHDARFGQRTGALGLARWRKEGFVSVRADATGLKSHLVTRPLRWPGGDLLVNADARGGYVQVRVTDVRRDDVPGFAEADTESFAGDATRHRVRWRGRSLDDLKDHFIRLEFEFVHADLFAFAAGAGLP